MKDGALPAQAEPAARAEAEVLQAQQLLPVKQASEEKQARAAGRVPQAKRVTPEQAEKQARAAQPPNRRWCCCW